MTVLSNKGYTIAIAIKVGLIITLIYSNEYVTRSYINFLSLYGTLCFLVIIVLEWGSKNYYLTLLGIIGLIIYQPLYSILKNDFADGLYEINMLPIQVTAIVILAWLVIDIIRLIKYSKRNNIGKSLNN